MSDKVKYSIREAAYEDAESLYALWYEHMRFHNLFEPRMINATSNDWKKWFMFVLYNQNCKIYVAEQDCNLIGYIIGTVKKIHPVLKNKYGEISEIFVINEEHGKGIPNNLLLKLSGWFLNKDIKTIEVKASPTNHKENEMWESLGFKSNWLLLKLDIGKKG